MAGKGYQTLVVAVRRTAFVQYLGVLCLSMTGIAAVPALFALAVGQYDAGVRSVVVTALLGGAGAILSRVRGPQQLQSVEALVIVATGYLITALLMAWPLAADGIAPLDAIFHSFSAITTTGLSTIESVAARSSSFQFTQAWMQWYGGLVIVILAVFIVGPGAAAKELSAAESGEGDVLSGTRVRAQRALLVYAGLTVIGCALLMALGADWSDAGLHALAAVSTGGFSPYDDSLKGLGTWPVQLGVTLVSLAGAVSLGRYHALLAWRPGHLPGKGVGAEVWGLLFLCALVSVLTTVSMALAGGQSWAEALRAGPLLALSAQSTAGFSPVSVAGLDEGSKLILVLSMFIGGSVGSTAGGIKIIRLLVIARLMHLTLLRPALPPHAVVHPRLDNRVLTEDDQQAAIGLVAVTLGVVVVSWLMFLLFGYPPLDALFEVVSATATVGLSAGVASPDLAPVLKAVLCLDMWMGRLEVIAVLLLFLPQTWFGRKGNRQ